MKKKILISLLLFITAIATNAQDITVNGTVVSATDSEPLIGANVVSAVKKPMVQQLISTETSLLPSPKAAALQYPILDMCLQP